MTKSLGLLLAMLGSLWVLPLSALAQTPLEPAFSAGDLIKSPSYTTVYYFGSDGRRYVFPDEKTYYTWFSNFSNVKVLSDSQLGVIPIGGNVTYRPGVRLVKVTTDPKVYAVDRGGTLRYVANEQLARDLYGMNWNTVYTQDLPDPFYVNYHLGTPLFTTSDYNVAAITNATTNIALDKTLPTNHQTVNIGSSSIGFVPATFQVPSGTEVQWINRDSVTHTSTGPNWDSGDIPPGSSYTRVMSSVGSFDYTCRLHPYMRGRSNVVSL